MHLDCEIPPLKVVLYPSVKDRRHHLFVDSHQGSPTPAEHLRPDDHGLENPLYIPAVVSIQHLPGDVRDVRGVVRSCLA